MESSQDHQENGVQQPSAAPLHLKVIDLNGKEIDLGIIQCELITELREALSDIVNTCFTTNYYFENNGDRLSDYAEISQLKEPVLYMREDTYTEISCRQHLKRFKEILFTPTGLNRTPDRELVASEESEIESKEDEKKQELKEETNSETKAEESKEVVKELSPEEQEKQQEEKEREMISEIKKQIQANKDRVIIPDKDAELKSLTDSFKIQITEDSEKFELVKCLEYIGLADSNISQRMIISKFRRIKGDLLHIKCKILEGIELLILGNSHGFTIVHSTKSAVFELKQKPNKPYQSHSLVGLIYQASPRFRVALQSHINNILIAEPFQLIKSPLPTTYWLSEKDATKDQSDKIQTEEQVCGLYGVDPKQNRDWNEEFQACKELPQDNLFQRIQRDRAFNKIYSDFVEAAKQGAMAIIDDCLTSLNPMDDKQQQIFVYNQIFFSFALDQYDDFTDTSGKDQNPTYKATNYDMQGLKTLQDLDIDGLHILSTAHVNYKGWRAVAQGIIPGILTTNDQSQLTEYGSVNEGKTIYKSDAFHDILTKVCEKLNIKTTKILDGDNKEIELAGSYDIKGIKGTDRRYLLDLIRLTPRDANYKDAEHSSYLVRPELILHYQRAQQQQYIKQKMESEPKELVTKLESLKEDASEEETKKYEVEKIKEIQEFNASQMKKYDEFMSTYEKKMFNVNIYTHAKFTETEETKKDQELVDDLGKFLVETQIPKIIKDLKQVQDVPTDSESLKNYLHQQGINLRYLGRIRTALKEEKINYMVSLVERVALERTLKHLINEQIRNCPSEQQARLVAHLLNIILSPKSIQLALNSRGISVPLIKPTKQWKVSDLEAEKVKSKKSKKSKTVIEEVKETENVFEVNNFFSAGFNSLSVSKKEDIFSGLQLTPEQLALKVKELAFKKFQIEFPANFWEYECLTDAKKSAKNKIAFLRDISLMVGIKLFAKDYQIAESEKIEPVYSALPFQENDIVDLQAIVRFINIQNKDSKGFILNGKNQLGMRLREAGFELISHGMNIQLQINGPINEEVSESLSYLANLHFKFGDSAQAIQLQRKCVIISEKIFGQIHPKTAFAYINLSQYHHEKSIVFMKRAIYILELVCGSSHPELAAVYQSLGLLYLEIDEQHAALDCFLTSQEKSKEILGEEIGGQLYSLIATTHQNLGDYRSALEYQEKAHHILVKHIKDEQSPLIQNSLARVKYLTQLSVQKQLEQSKNGSRQIGQNKASKPANDNQRQIGELMSKLTRGSQGVDMMKLQYMRQMQQQQMMYQAAVQRKEAQEKEDKEKSSKQEKDTSAQDQ